MARIVRGGRKTVLPPSQPVPSVEVPCTCGGENPNCMHCDGLGIIKGRRTPPVVHRSEAQIVRQAAEEATRVSTSSAMTMDRFKTLCLAHLQRLRPGHHCSVTFATAYPFRLLTPGAMAYRTSDIMAEGKGVVAAITWRDPDHADFVVHSRNAAGKTRINAKIEYDYAGRVSATYSDPVLIKPEVRDKPLTPLQLALQKLQARAQSKSNKAARRKGKKQPSVTAPPSAKPQPAKGNPKGPQKSSPKPAKPRPPINDILGAKLRQALDEQADTRFRPDERELDATRGMHAFREFGSGQFGSAPSHDDYDN